MTMTIEELRDLLDGLVAAGMGASDFKLHVQNMNYGHCNVESATIAKSLDEVLIPTFMGSIYNA